MKIKKSFAILLSLATFLPGCSKSVDYKTEIRNFLANAKVENIQDYSALGYAAKSSRVDSQVST